MSTFGPINNPQLWSTGSYTGPCVVTATSGHAATAWQSIACDTHFSNILILNDEEYSAIEFIFNRKFIPGRLFEINVVDGVQWAWKSGISIIAGSECQWPDMANLGETKVLGLVTFAELKRNDAQYEINLSVFSRHGKDWTFKIKDSRSDSFLAFSRHFTIMDKP